MKILVVDDNADDRKLLRLNLERHGCGTVIEGRDGQEGLDLARAHRPDLIISDAMMPRMDGFAFLRAAKTDEVLKAIPFVFHSSVYTGFRDEELASRLGAEAFITKPKAPEEFWGEIAVILERLAAGATKPPPVEPVEEEKEYLREYSGVVAAKLEEKVRELEESLARQKEAEEALRKSERFLNSIIENIPDMIFVKDTAELRFVLFNRAGEELLGCSREELTGKGDHDLFPPGEADSLMARDREIISGGRLVDIPEETVLTRRKGRRVLHTKKIPIPDETGAPRYLLGISEDITERRQAEETLQKLSTAVEQSPVSIVITDLKGDIEFVNPKFTQMTGYETAEAVGQNTRIMKSGETARETYEDLWTTIASGNVWRGELHNRKKRGELFWEAETISPIKNKEGVTTHYIAIKEDITERKALEDQLRQAQKMEAVGTLAGGVAHDFNNMLTAIIGFSSILEMKMAKDDPLRSHVTQILSAADRAAALTRSLLSFSRRQAIEAKPVLLNEIVTGLEKMLRRVIREDIDLRLNLAQDNPTVKADAGQIEQVLLNLATNARDAMPGGGWIAISTGQVFLDEEFRRIHGYGEPGAYALLVFADAGCGMEDGIRQRIFEPFYTTKEVGKGTGLGLSVCYGIVKQHRGYITCYSEPGSGTTFRIYLPLAQAPAVAREGGASTVPVRGTETILVAEDDPTVRGLIASILAEFGYTVVEAQDGEEAVERFMAEPARIDLCLFDVIMPKKEGPEAFEAIRQIRPEVRGVFMSGYQEDLALRNALQKKVAGFIAKPVVPRELLRKVREALEGRTVV